MFIQHLIKQSDVPGSGLRPVQSAGATLASVGGEVRRDLLLMAPQYAPSLRSCLGPMLLVLQLGFILIYAFYIEIESNVKVYGITFSNLYPGEFERGVG